MSSSDIAISVRGLGKSYTIAHNAEKHVTLAETMLHRLRRPFHRPERETFWALKDVSFDIKRGDVVGIIGRNGAGKSTLLKVLSRITEPTNGEIDVYGRVGSLLEVGTGFHPELTGRENIYLNGQILGMRKKEIDRQFDAIVEFAGTEKFLDTPVKRYSSGMYVRLAFAVAAHLQSEILVVDEVLAVGDAEFQKKCLGKMKDVACSGRTVLFVSHNMAAVSELCTSAYMLQSGSVHRSGELSDVIAAYLDQHSVAEISWDDGPLRSIGIRQVGDYLELNARYEVAEPIELPCLGFVISDAMGMPICGSNPRIDKALPSGGESRAGSVRAVMREPRLLDGTYRLSIWFGDGVQELATHRDCMAFSVVGMAGSRQLPAAAVGPVSPRCLWSFESHG